MIKKISLALLFILITHVSSFSQNDRAKFSLKCGYGYFNDIYGISRKSSSYNTDLFGKPGFMVWNEFSYFMPNKVNINFFVGYGQVKEETQNLLYKELFDPYIETNTYLVFNPNFSKPFTLKKFCIEPGLGAVLRRWLDPTIDLNIDQANHTLNSINPEFEEILEIGLSFDLNTSYNLSNKMQLGIKLKTYSILAIGLEGFLCSPYITITI